MPEPVKPTVRAGLSSDLATVSDHVKNLLDFLKSPDLANASWWSSFLPELLLVIAFIVGVFHPGFHIPARVQDSIGVVSIAAAGLVGSIRVFTAGQVHKAKIMAAAQVHAAAAAMAYAHPTVIDVPAKEVKPADAPPAKPAAPAKKTPAKK